MKLKHVLMVLMYNCSSVWPSSRHFQKCVFLKVLLATLIMVVMKTEMRMF